MTNKTSESMDWQEEFDKEFVDEGIDLDGFEYTQACGHPEDFKQFIQTLIDASYKRGVEEERERTTEMIKSFDEAISELKQFENRPKDNLNTYKQGVTDACYSILTKLKSDA